MRTRLSGGVRRARERPALTRLAGSTVNILSSLQMNNIHIAPLLFQILPNQSPVAVVRLVLAAEQAGLVHHRAGYSFLDPPPLHQLEEAVLVPCPIVPMLLVRIENILRRRQLRPVLVTDPADCTEEVPKVVLLCESSELRDVVQAHVDDLLHAGFREARKERLSSRLGKPDRVQLQRPTPCTVWSSLAADSE